MAQTISIVMALVVGLVIIGLLIVIVGDKMGRGSNVANDNIDTTVDSLECRIDCADCCSSGYGDTTCAKQYSSCACSCD